jgi:GT2 family glycosyltransferase
MLIFKLDMKLQKIFIVIPVYNRINFTVQCLRSLEMQTVKDFNIIVVDDGSQDETNIILAEKFPNVTVLTGDGNLWWAGAMNMGVKYALNNGAEYILSLNNDLEVAEDYIENMIYWAEKNPQAIFGSYVFDIATKNPIGASGRMCWSGKFTSLLNVVPPQERSGIYSVTHLSGRGLWIPSIVFERIGFFDSVRFPQLAADTDFSLNASRHDFELYSNFDARLYCYINEFTGHQYLDHFSFKNYILSLTDIKGSCNIKHFIQFAFKNCPYRWVIWYLIRGILIRLIKPIFIMLNKGRSKLND